MLVREKRINGYSYLYLVETVREHGRARQRIIKNLGRKEVVTASGALERLASSVARYAERALVLSQIDASNPDGLACKRIGAPLGRAALRRRRQVPAPRQRRGGDVPELPRDPRGALHDARPRPAAVRDAASRADR